MTNVMTITEDTLKSSDWMNNKPSSKLSHSPHGKRRDYVQEVLDFKNNSILQRNPQIANQIVDLIMSFWSVFYRDGNCGPSTLPIRANC